jgi:RecJ-like exonuclease
MDKPGVGVAICMGDRGAALEQASVVLEEYRGVITKYLNWLLEPETGRMEEFGHIWVAHGDSVIDDKIIGTISSILSTTLVNPEKPIIAYSTVQGEGIAKFSARGIDSLVKKGLDLGEVLRIGAEKYGGRGGGHDIAAGAQVPLEHAGSFLKQIDELVKRQLAGESLGG